MASFINEFNKNIWLVFLGSKLATHQSLSLRDSTIASAVSKIQALTLSIPYRLQAMLLKFSLSAGDILCIVTFEENLLREDIEMRKLFQRHRDEIFEY